MAPSFFSKLVRTPNSNSRDRSESSPSPTPSATGRRSFSASFRSRAASVLGGESNGHGNSSEEIPPVPSISAQFASANGIDKNKSPTTDAASISDSGHHPDVTVVPPSPSLTSEALISAGDYESSLFERPVDGLPKTEEDEAAVEVAGLPETLSTKTPPVPRPSSAQSRHAPPSRPSTPPHPQTSSATVGTSSSPMSFLLSPAIIRRSASNKSLNGDTTPSSHTTIMSSPEATPASHHSRSATTPAHMGTSHSNDFTEPAFTPISESPTSEFPPASLPRQRSNNNLSASPRDNSDAASIMTTATKKKRQGSGWRRAPKPSATGLAGAIAASGLAMVNPGMTSPHAQLSPSATMPAPARSRSRANSINTSPPARSPSRARSGSPRSTKSRNGKSHKHRALSISGVSDANSLFDENTQVINGTAAPVDYYSGLEDSSSEGESDEESEDDPLNDIEYEEDEIPVTGFAVASSRRNQEFHELFTTIPAEDYLIEDYGCALQREILLQGRLYISENHICFHANIFGWVTDLSIPIHEITHLEKKMTAFVIPNAILITTRQNKYSFTSFLSRDTTYDVIYNIWRLVRPGGGAGDSASFISGRGSVDAGRSTDQITEGAVIGSRGEGLLVTSGGKVKPKVTECACGKEGRHYSEKAMEVVLPGTPDRIHNLIFQSGFMKDFLSINQKLIDLQVSDWKPLEVGSTLLARNMSYIKPLNGSVGPRQTKCEIRDETDHADFEQYVSMITTTRTPDVPSGGAFSVKTRTCIMWASAMSTKVVVTTQVEWTGRSFIKGIIDRSAIDGQKTYHADLEKEMRAYIQQHRTEFIPEGIDPAILTPAVEVDETSGALAGNKEESSATSVDAKQRERERNQRSLQWAWDTFEGTRNVAVQSTRDLLEILKEAWEQSTSTTILIFLIVFLVMSNIYTLTKVGSREEVGRRKEILQREKWVEGVVNALWEEMNAQQRPGGIVAPSSAENNWSMELEALQRTLDAVEERTQKIRQGLLELKNDVGATTVD